jgi:UDP-N-acetylglucosamine:LPS N-acetylglucosamine transferase
MPPEIGRKQICIVGLGGGGFHGEAELIISNLTTEPDLVLIFAGPNGGIKEWRTKGNIVGEYVVESPTLIGTSKFSSVLRLHANFWAALRILRKEDIGLVLGVGTSQFIPFALAARLLGCKSFFVESITRIQRPSLTQRLVKKTRLASRVFDFASIMRG